MIYHANCLAVYRVTVFDLNDLKYGEISIHRHCLKSESEDLEKSRVYFLQDNEVVRIIDQSIQCSPRNTLLLAFFLFVFCLFFNKSE